MTNNERREFAIEGGRMSFKHVRIGECEGIVFRIRTTAKVLLPMVEK